MQQTIEIRGESDMSHLERIAWRKAGSIPYWELFAWERIDPTLKRNDFIVKGGIPRLLAKGKYKGRKTWKDSNVYKCVVAEEEIAAEEKSFSENTGKCHRCLGRGEVFASWNKDNGTTYRPCKPCNATGKHNPTHAENEGA